MCIQYFYLIVLLYFITIHFRSTLAGNTCQDKIENYCHRELDEDTPRLETELLPDFDVFSAEQKLFRIPTKPNVGTWPGGLVKYKLNATLTPSELNELHAAINEYQEKTCVRFQLKSRNDPRKDSYVSIERNDIDIECGLASTCRRGKGYQYARFNTICMFKDSFIHELGHSLCLGHEYERHDRDQFVLFDDCGPPPKKGKNRRDLGIYDYASQMHYACGTCLGGTPVDGIPPVCGDQAHFGLSVLDADTVNQLYNCEACHRHRWIPINLLSDQDKEDMYSFGSVDILGREIFPCRAFHLGEVAIGQYTHEDETCRISSLRSNSSEEVKKYVEILTIPGGLSANCLGSSGRNEHIFQYELKSNLDDEFKETLLKDGVPGGSLILDHKKYFVGYVAFGTVASDYFGDKVDGDGDEVFVVDGIGTAWNETGELNNALFSTSKGYPLNVNSFKVLVCK